MSPEPELLWTGATLLVLVGVAAGLCVRCSRSGAKKAEKIYEQRPLQENQQSFAVARTYSFVRQMWPGPLADAAPDSALKRKDKLLQFSPSVEGSESPRYQNFSKGSRHGSDTGYVDPIVGDYYNWGRFQKPPEEEDDTGSYENVLICKPGSPEPAAQHKDRPGGGALKHHPGHSSATSCAHPNTGDESVEDYQNSVSIQQWNESKRVMGLALSDTLPTLAGSPDEDSEPDYVNGDVMTNDS